MYRNRHRLAQALSTLVEQYGPEVFNDPRRTRNLLVDEYGADQVDRADINQFTAVLEAAGTSITEVDEPLSSASASLAASAGVTMDDAAWTITTLRSLTARVRPGPVPQRHVAGPVGPTTLDLDEVVVRAAPAVDTSWPRPAKVAAGVLAAVAIALGVIGGLLVVNARREAADLRDREAAIEHDLSSAQQSAGDKSKTLGQRIDDLNKQVQDARADAADAQRQLDAAKSGADIDAATIADLTTRVDAANASVTDLTSQRDSANATLDDVRQQLAAANAALAPFGVGQGGVSVPFARFKFTGDTTTCDGFKAGVECTRYRSFNGYVRQDGADKWFEIPGVVKIPLTSADGLGYTGQAGTPGTGINCDGSPSEAIFTVTIEPVSFSADPASKQIIATAYTASLDLYSPPTSDCRDSRQGYGGLLTFEGLS